MASELFGQRFRRSVGDRVGLANPADPNAMFSNDEIDDYGNQADEDYPDASFNAKVAYAVMLGYSDIRALYAPQVSYTQNQSSESLGQAFDHYDGLVKQWQKRFEDLLAQNTPDVMWGSSSVFPTREEEYPDA